MGERDAGTRQLGDDALRETSVKRCIYPGCERPAVPPHPAGGLRMFDLEEFRGWLADAGLKITEETGRSQAVFIHAEKTS